MVGDCINLLSGAVLAYCFENLQRAISIYYGLLLGVGRCALDVCSSCTFFAISLLSHFACVKNLRGRILLTTIIRGHTQLKANASERLKYPKHSGAAPWLQLVA